MAFDNETPSSDTRLQCDDSPILAQALQSLSGSRSWLKVEAASRLQLATA